MSSNNKNDVKMLKIIIVILCNIELEAYAHTFDLFTPSLDISCYRIYSINKHLFHNPIGM